MGQRISHKIKSEQRISSKRQLQQKPLSDFYLACRDGNIEVVENLLPLMSIEQINCYEPNGSTALHAASYHGHIEIVRLLLLAGASRCLKNLRFNLTPYEEARNNDIRRLYARVNLPTQARFVGSSLKAEWSLDTFYAAEWKTHLSSLLQPELSFKEIILFLQENYIKDYVKLTPRELEKIILLFRCAYDHDDAIFIVQAYTSATQFYRIVNNHLEQYLLKCFRFENDQSIIEQCVAHLASIFIHRSELKSWEFTGTVYRGLLLVQSDFELYTENKYLLNKTFLSTSTEREVALVYAGTGNITQMRKSVDKNPLQFSALCIYKIKNPATALNISSISEIPCEREVLIMPLCAFHVQSVVKNVDDNDEAQFVITLEECDDPAQLEKQNIKKKTRPRVT